MSNHGTATYRRLSELYTLVTKVLAFFVGYSRQLHASTKQFLAVISSDWAPFTAWINHRVASIRSEDSAFV